MLLLFGGWPWHNGSTEALSKTIKRALNVVIGSQVCLQSSRLWFTKQPSWWTSVNLDDGTYLCYNDLILGCVSKEQSVSTTQLHSGNCGAFLERSSREVFHSVVDEPKWHVERINVSTGDVVMIQDSNIVREEWKSQKCGGKVQEWYYRYQS